MAHIPTVLPGIISNSLNHPFNFNKNWTLKKQWTHFKGQESQLTDDMLFFLVKLRNRYKRYKKERRAKKQKPVRVQEELRDGSQKLIEQEQPYSSLEQKVLSCSICLDFNDYR
jgi:hypothetical protein